MTTGGSPVPVIYGGTGSTTAAAARAALGISSTLVWTVYTVNSVIPVNTGIIANKGSLLTMTLPTTSAVGDMIAITGINTALGWRIAQNASQQIFFGVTQTTAGILGSLSSIAIRDTVTLVCVVADLNWNIINSTGNISVI